MLLLNNKYETGQIERLLIMYGRANVPDTGLLSNSLKQC